MTEALPKEKICALVRVPAPSQAIPWEIHPALTEERLRVCARLLANARRDSVRMASPEMGDDSWSIGCRAYAFCKQLLQRTDTTKLVTAKAERTRR